MSIREEAKRNPGFAALYDVYLNREKAILNWKKQGKKVVGELGCDVPDELILAAGMFPVHVYADPKKSLIETDKYLEFAFDPVVRAQFEKIVDGTYSSLIDYLAISNSTDVIIRIYLYLREIRRQEKEKPVPPIEFIDWLFTRNRMHQERNELLISKFRQAVEQWAGRTVTDEEIMSAAAVCNEDRDALRAMSALRRCAQPRINGSEALVIIGSSFFMDRGEHAKLVRAVVKDAENWPVVTGRRVFVTGSSQESTELYDMIETAGGVVVGEDHDWGDRYYDRNINLTLDPIHAIVDRYMLREFSSKKAFVSQRVEALNRSVNAAGADGVVFYMNIYEEAASWDYPSQKKSLEEHGIATAAFVNQQYPVYKNEGLKDELIAFIESMKGGKS